MRITVQLSASAASQLHEFDRTTREARAGRVLGWLDSPLEPVHPGTTDPALQTFFNIEVEDPAAASRLVERLLRDPAVTGAYIKPPDELP
jgi:hypothetical protein